MKNENRNLNEAGKKIEKLKAEWSRRYKIARDTDDDGEREMLSKHIQRLIKKAARIRKAANEAGFAMYQQALKKTA